MAFATISNKLFGHLINLFLLFSRPFWFTPPLTITIFCWNCISYQWSTFIIQCIGPFRVARRRKRSPSPFFLTGNQVVTKISFSKVEVKKKKRGLALLDVHLQLWFRALGETSSDAQSLVEREAKTEKKRHFCFCFVVLCAYFYHRFCYTIYQENKLLAKNGALWPAAIIGDISLGAGSEW